VTTPFPAAILNAPRITLLPASPLDSGLFTLGEIIPAKWVRSLDPQRVLIQVKGRAMVAQAAFPLPEETAFQVRVEQLAPRVILKLILTAADGPAATVLLKKYWIGDPPLEKIIAGWEALDRLKGSSLPEEVQETRTQLREMIQSFSRMVADGPDPQALARVIDQSGLNLENKLRRLITPDGQPSRPAVPEEDLKGLFLKIKSQLERAAPETARELQPIIQKMELYQLLNAGEGDPAKLLLLLPLFFPEGLRWSEIFFSEGRGDEAPAEERGKKLLFLLDFPALGKLQIEIRIREHRLFGRFQTADPRIGAYLEENRCRLSACLGAAGYLADIEIRVVDPSLLQEVLPARMEGFPDSLVSVVV
jgi:hypothetical protein